MADRCALGVPATPWLAHAALGRLGEGKLAEEGRWRFSAPAPRPACRRANPCQGSTLPSPPDQPSLPNESC